MAIRRHLCSKRDQAETQAASRGDPVDGQRGLLLRRATPRLDSLASDVDRVEPADYAAGEPDGCLLGREID